MLESKVKSLIKKHRVKCNRVSYEGNRLILQVRETKSTASKLYDDLKKLGLYPRSIAYGRWEFSTGNKYQEDAIDE